MVSRKQHQLTMRSAFWVAAITFTGALGQQGFAADQGRKFYADDPLWRTTRLSSSCPERTWYGLQSPRRAPTAYTSASA